MTNDDGQIDYELIAHMLTTIPIMLILSGVALMYMSFSADPLHISILQLLFGFGLVVAGMVLVRILAGPIYQEHTETSPEFEGPAPMDFDQMIAALRKYQSGERGFLPAQHIIDVLVAAARQEHAMAEGSEKIAEALMKGAGPILLAEVERQVKERLATIKRHLEAKDIRAALICVNGMAGEA